LGSAGYYEPAVYDLLTFYSSLTTQSDELDGQFVPITAVQPKSNQQTLIMAIGILPPSSNVTGRLLSRAATIAPVGPPYAGVNTNQSQIPGPSGAGATSLSANGVAFIAAHEGFVPNAYTATTAEGQAGIQTIGYGHVIQPGESFPNGITQDQAQALLAKDSQWAQNTVNNNVSGPLTQNQYDALVSYAYSTGPSGFSKYGAGIIQSLNANPPDYDGAAAQWPTSAVTGVNGQTVPQLVTIRANETNLFQTPEDQTYQYNIHSNHVNDPPTQTSITGDGSNPTNNWQGTGSPNASSAQSNIAGTANTSLDQTDLGLQYLAAQQSEINNTLAAIQQMQNTPPLKMLVNPQSFKLAAEKIISDGEWSRSGPIVEQWGEQLDKIEASGKVAAFYSIDATGGGSAGSTGVGAGPGITRTARQYSASYQNFLSLWLLYKSNGGVWLSDFIEPKSSKKKNLSVVGSIYIYYDNILYVGSFDDFNLSETETAPYTLEYNFTFTVRATFLLANTSAQQLTYGAPPALISGQAPSNQVTASTQPVQTPPTNSAQIAGPDSTSTSNSGVA
jgi:GH24 family phage-related lysozyme (muramidase)